jgi:hypothetical protein
MSVPVCLCVCVCVCARARESSKFRKLFTIESGAPIDCLTEDKIK